MPINLKLPSLDNNPILLAETRSNRFNEFIQRLPFGDPINAANDLIDELQILNSQKVAFANRINALDISAKLGNNALEGDTLDCNASGKPSKIIINQLIERTVRFECFQFSLI